MSKVIAGFAMSLDGFIADANDDVGLVYAWLGGGDTPVVNGDGHTFMTSAVSAAHFQNILDTTGAIVTGRRDFDVSRAWGGKSPIAGAHIFIVTHHPPAEWIGTSAPFTFVPEGVEAAIEQARKIAGEKNITIGGSKIAQQALKAGLVDEIHIDLTPVLLGTGIRLFDALDGMIRLENIAVQAAPNVAHLQFRVVKL